MIFKVITEDKLYKNKAVLKDEKLSSLKNCHPVRNDFTPLRFTKASP